MPARSVVVERMLCRFMLAVVVGGGWGAVPGDGRFLNGWSMASPTARYCQHGHRLDAANALIRTVVYCRECQRQRRLRFSQRARVAKERQAALGRAKAA